MQTRHTAMYCTVIVPPKNFGRDFFLYFHLTNLTVLILFDGLIIDELMRDNDSINTLGSVAET
jgi:hypothetical protein